MLWFYTLDNDSAQAHIGRRARNNLFAGDFPAAGDQVTTPTNVELRTTSKPRAKNNQIPQAVAL
jgi:hypothetical protein